jgi:hypothetical protein
MCTAGRNLRLMITWRFVTMIFVPSYRRNASHTTKVPIKMAHRMAQTPKRAK